jgi:hypothetical protein
VCGYDAAVLRALEQEELSAQALADAGAAQGARLGLYTLALSMVPGDLA